MNTRPQITIVEDKIRIPAWRNASPKNRNTRAPYTSRNTRPQNFAISPKLATQSRGSVNQPIRAPHPTASRRPAHQWITDSSGWVANSVCVNT